MGIERINVVGILLHDEHLIERNAPIGREKSQQKIVILVSLRLVFDGSTSSFIGPARERPTEMRREDRMRYFVRQHGIQNPFGATVYFHLPADRSRARSIACETETRLAAGLCFEPNGHRAFFRPLGKFSTKPLNRQIVAIFFGCRGDLFGKLRVRRGDNEILGRVVCAQQKKDYDDGDEFDPSVNALDPSLDSWNGGSGKLTAAGFFNHIGFSDVLNS